MQNPVSAHAPASAPRTIIRRPVRKEAVKVPEMLLPSTEVELIKQVVFERTRRWKHEKAIGCFI